jgi:hypothetical protein
VIFLLFSSFGVVKISLRLFYTLLLSGGFSVVVRVILISLLIGNISAAAKW